MHVFLFLITMHTYLCLHKIICCLHSFILLMVQSVCLFIYNTLQRSCFCFVLSLLHLGLIFFFLLCFSYQQPTFVPPPAPQPAVKTFVPSSLPSLKNADQYQQPSLGAQLYPVCISPAIYCICCFLFIPFHS